MLCTAVICAKTSELIDMLFVLSENHVLDFPIGTGKFEGKGMPRHARRHSAVSCAKTSEPIEMSFGL